MAGSIRILAARVGGVLTAVAVAWAVSRLLPDGRGAGLVAPEPEAPASRPDPAAPRVVVGRVVRADTGEPISGARIVVRPGPPCPNDVVTFVAGEDRLSPEILVEGTTSDASGRFRARIFSSEPKVHLSAVHPEWLTTESEVLDAAAAGETTLRMKAGATLVVAFESPDSADVFGRLRVESSGGEKRHVTLRGGRTCRLGGIPTGTVRVRLEGLRTEGDDGLVQPAPPPLEVAAGDVRTVSLALRRGLDVSVRAIRRGGAVIEADVHLWARGASIGRQVAEYDDGVHVFRGVPAGRVEATVRARGGESVSRSLEVDEETRQFDVEVPEGIVGGCVRVADTGTVAAGVELWLRGIDREKYEGYVTHTGKDGTYAFRDLAAGRYRMTIAERDSVGGDEDDRHPSFLPDSREVEVVDGKRTTADFEVRPAGAVTVHVADAAGQPLVGAVVTLIPDGTTSTADSRWHSYFESGGTSGRDGGVRIIGLAAGRYVAHLDQSEFGELRSAPVEVAAGTEGEARIQTGPAVRIRLLLHFVGDDGRVVGVYPTARLLDATGARVRTELPHAGKDAVLALVEAGEYRLVVEHRDWQPVDRLVHATGPSPQVVRVTLETRRR